MKLLKTKKLSMGMAAGAIALTAAMALASPAHAASDYTASGGPDANFVGTNVSFTAAAVPTPQTLTCSQFDLAGSVVDPGVSRFFGDIAGTMDVLTSSGCTNPIAGATTVTPYGVWDFAITGAESGTVSPAQLGNVGATVTAAGCSFNVEGEVGGTFDDATQVFTPGSSTLEIVTTPVGFICPILGVAMGQDVTVDGTWENIPPSGSTDIVITNP